MMKGRQPYFEAQNVKLKFWASKVKAKKIKAQSEQMAEERKIMSTENSNMEHDQQAWFAQDSRKNMDIKDWFLCTPSLIHKKCRPLSTKFVLT